MPISGGHLTAAASAPDLEKLVPRESRALDDDTWQVTVVAPPSLGNWSLQAFVVCAGIGA